MRIRKNSLRVTSESGTHLCQLNQSPWDVPTTFSSSSTPFFQVQADESFLENMALQRVASPKKSLAGGDKNGFVDYKELEKKAVDIINYCSKTDENGNWICGLEAKEGETFCEFHLHSYIAPLGQPVTKKNSSNINQAKKPKSESNPYKSLYYYDGFGPTWGKRRVARELSKKSENVAMQLPDPDFEDYEDDMEEVETENGNDNGKKRARRRIKARSLKSLM